MNERELSLIRALGEEFSLALGELRESFIKSLSDYQRTTEEQLKQLSLEVMALKDTPAPDFTTLLADAVVSLPVPEAPELPDIGAMVSEAVSALPVPQDGKSVTVEEILPVLAELVSKAVGEMPVPKDGKDYDPEALKQAVDDAVSKAVAEIPVPEDGKSVTVEEILPVLAELVSKAVGEMPVPKDGKDCDPEALKQAVDDAVSEAVAEIPVPQDGKSVTVEDIRPVLQELITAAMPEIPDVKALISEAMAEIPAPEPGRPGEDGRDALALELLPFIDGSKSYPRGSYATHNGGLWRAYEKTHGMRGWECVVDGVAGVDVGKEGMRNFTVTVNHASGASEKKTFDLPVMVYRGVFKSGDEYLPGDTVTWGGSLWHCDEQTQGKPGETGAKGWTLAAKRGRDGRDKT
ncbi:phage gp6-like head-tail connector protein [Citrobacter youngae]|uniref:phage gp6-like head-tail connector protein n=1 Tax=Citrobacter youngae TaxID=133448 RepID=UPI00207CA63C|nr:phage gp6-like head-tail connector protein [Citrobacter youngae]